MPSAILTTFSGAIQASFSVLLVIFYGVVAAQFELIDNASAKKVSRLSVKLFLPFLLISKVGKELSLESVRRYGPILGWSVFYNIVSMVIGASAVKWLKLPVWVTPAVTFNNTTSLPLLLLQSLESTGILNSIVNEGDSVSDAISRAQSYFLVCSVVSNCITFALGPRLLKTGSDEDHDDDNQRQDGVKPDDEVHRQGDQHQDQPEETTSLLPDRMNEAQSDTFRAAHGATHNVLRKVRLSPKHISSRTKTALSILFSFVNAPLVGALIGCTIGLTPGLHKVFFADTTDGGIFTAWLTASIKNTGDLFVSLQVIIVGVKLSSSLRRTKRGANNSGHIPWSAAAFVFGIRFVFWPLVSVSTIYWLAGSQWARNAGMGGDKMLWFSMMLMPAGPPAMSLIPMADVGDNDENVKMSVAKILTWAYAASPVLAFVVVGALKVSQAAL